MPKDRRQITQEIQLAVGKLILSQLSGRRELARAIFNALLPKVSMMQYYNASLKCLTELTLGAAGGEDANIECRPGERPRLKNVIRTKNITLSEALDDLPEKL